MADPTWDHPQWINYFRNDLAQSVNHDVRQLLPAQGSFGVPRQFFPYIEYLSGLVYGPISADMLSNGPRAEQFLAQHMPMEPLYGTQARLLINMWRHGTIHRYQPKVLQNADGSRRLGWLSYYGTRTNQDRPLASGPAMTVSHLTIWRSQTDTLDYLPVCIECLVDDLDAAIENIAVLLENEQTTGGTALRDNMQNAAQVIHTPAMHNTNPFAW
jgi:hypothetical protein